MSASNQAPDDDDLALFQNEKFHCESCGKEAPLMWQSQHVYYCSQRDVLKTMKEEKDREAQEKEKLREEEDANLDGKSIRRAARKYDLDYTRREG